MRNCIVHGECGFLPSKYKYIIDSIDRLTHIGALKYHSKIGSFNKKILLPYFEETFRRPVAPSCESLCYSASRQLYV